MLLHEMLTGIAIVCPIKDYSKSRFCVIARAGFSLLGVDGETGIQCFADLHRIDKNSFPNLHAWKITFLFPIVKCPDRWSSCGVREHQLKTGCHSNKDGFNGLLCYSSHRSLVTHECQTVLLRTSYLYL